jgi:hypothetical protein
VLIWPGEMGDPLLALQGGSAAWATIAAVLRYQGEYRVLTMRPSPAAGRPAEHQAMLRLQPITREPGRVRMHRPPRVAAKILRRGTARTRAAQPVPASPGRAATRIPAAPRPETERITPPGNRPARTRTARARTAPGLTAPVGDAPGMRAAPPMIFPAGTPPRMSPGARARGVADPAGRAQVRPAQATAVRCPGGCPARATSRRHRPGPGSRLSRRKSWSGFAPS